MSQYVVIQSTPFISKPIMPMLIMPDNIIDRDSVQVAYIDNLVDDMDLETMKELLCEFMNESYDKVSIDDLIEEVEHFYPELLES